MNQEPQTACEVDAEAEAARKKSNLAFSFMSLNPEQRYAMSVFYDFCREVDDIADDRETDDAYKQQQMDIWYRDIQACYDGEENLGKAKALNTVITGYKIPQKDLLAILDGVSMDIGGCRFADVDALKKYCYGVASAVGLVSVKVFDCKHPNINEFAITLGYALQFTNILRDVVEDLQEMGRVYLPQDELAAFNVTEEDLRNPDNNPNCKRLFELQYYRCKHFFNKARRLLPETDRQNLKAALIMGAFYEDILEKIRRSNFRIGAKRIKISKYRKLYLLQRTTRQLRKPMKHLAKANTVAVWGAGVAGLSAAIHLGLEGFTPQVFEAKRYAGGRAHSLTDAPTGLTLDNGQHIVMGCYENFLSLINTLNIGHKLERQDALCVPYISPNGKVTELKAAKLPAPFNLLIGLFRFGELSFKDCIAICRLGLSIRLGQRPKPDETVEAWFKRLKQSPNAIRALWEPFCIAALNEPITTASATLLHETLKRSLFGSAEDAKIYLSKVGLSELFLPEAQLYLKAIGGELQLSTQIKSIQQNSNTITGFTTSKGATYQAGLYVSALPWSSLKSLLEPDKRLREKIDHIPSSAILSVHLLCNKQIFENKSQFIGLLDSPIHWVFDRSHTLPEKYKGQHLYAVIVSAANEWLNLHSKEIVERLLEELKRFFPHTADMEVERELVYKSKDATFAAQPQIEAFRPTQTEAPWDNLILSGDWVQTALPATLEGAALSGKRIVTILDRNCDKSQS